MNCSPLDNLSVPQSDQVESQNVWLWMIPIRCLHTIFVITSYSIHYTKLYDDAISWVNEGDWAEYTLNVPVDGEYTITYSISSSKNGAEIQFIVDGNVVSTDAVNNNASWNTWYDLEASNKATLTKGSHTIWVKGVGANNDFQWNLEKITLSKTNDETMHINDELLEDVILSPNPFDNTLQINGGETIASLKVTALNGVTLVFKEVNATSIVLNTNDLSSGIFLILV